MKFLLRFCALLAFLVLLWIGLSQLPWRRWLNIDQLSEKKEKQLSELLLKAYSRGKTEIRNDSVLYTINTIRNRICAANGIDTADIHLHVYQFEQVNAITIPMGHILIYSGLIKECDNAEMLAGIMAHEIAHSELNHISKKLAREIGLSTIAGILGDNSGILLELVRTLSSRGFDRSQEQDADNKAVQYLQRANIDTRPMGRFLQKLAKEEKDMPKSFEWVSTHPNSAKRAKTILSKAVGGNYQPVTDSITWQKAKTSLSW